MTRANGNVKKQPAKNGEIQKRVPPFFAAYWVCGKNQGVIYGAEGIAFEHIDSIDMDVLTIILKLFIIEKDKSGIVILLYK